jgi:hypothetical protein
MFKTTAVLSLLAAAALTAPTAAQAWTAEVYGGAVFDRNEDYGGVSMSLDSGTAFGAGIYQGFPGFELGVDIMHTQADYSGTDMGVKSLSAMLNGRVPIWSSGTGTTVYAGAGIGAIRVKFDGGTTLPAGTGSDTVAGAQLGLGVRYNLAAFTAFSELKYQFAFDDATIQGVNQSYATTSLVVGFRF